jgi:hypothetical protein
MDGIDATDRQVPTSSGIHSFWVWILEVFEELT